MVPLVNKICRHLNKAVLFGRRRVLCYSGLVCCGAHPLLYSDVESEKLIGPDSRLRIAERRDWTWISNRETSDVVFELQVKPKLTQKFRLSLTVHV